MISKIFDLTAIDAADEQSLCFWQKKIFNCLFSIFLILCIFPYILGCNHALGTSEWHRILVYTVFYLWAAGVRFLKKIPFHIRVLAGVFLFYFMGIFSMLSTGLIGSTRLYFLCFSTFAVIFSGIKAGVFTLIINVITLVAFGVMYENGGIFPPQWVPTPEGWGALTLTFFFLCAAMILSPAILITALKISGREFNHLKKTREKELRQLKNDLKAAEKFKAMGILAGSVAHDLNNILSGIATYPEVLMMDKTLDPKLRQGLSLIKDSGEKASAVVSDLLTISRGASVEKEIININAIIDRYILTREFDTMKKPFPRVTLNMELEPELLNIKGSYLHMEKTIMNLVLNAMEEVSGKEDGRVFITTANNYIDPSVPKYEKMVQGEYVILSVMDNGSGIDNAFLEKIFDPFFTQKKMGKSGTGLGLTIVWNAVQDHNGVIQVTSNGKGTRFDLLFPATRQEIETAAPCLDGIKGQGQKILIVTDLKAQQDIALHILERLGYQAQAVDNGTAAIDVIKNNAPDLVILDMILSPSISGLETYKRIKKIHPDQKAIFASGFSESEDVLMAQDMGAGNFIKKPYTLLDMGIAIKEELEK